jgi:hypothetical protein
MNDRGPSLRHQTKPAQLDIQRFTLEWVLPLEPGLSTDVTLFDLECFPPHALAAGEGADEADALLQMWMTLTARDDPSDAMAHVAEACDRRTGRQPDRRPSHRASTAPDELSCIDWS